MVKNPLARMWIGKATIMEYTEVIDEETCQTKMSLKTVCTDEPCRLSHKSEVTLAVNNGAPYATQSIVLFIRPDLTINAGSVIEVTQHGVTNKYKRASKPSIYTNHQEIVLELYEDNA